jgi:phosphocarrier protein
MSSPTASGDVVIVNQLGLHARAAAKLVGLANKFTAEVWIARDEREVNAKSILGVLMLACARGTTIRLRTEGADAEAAFSAVAQLVRDGFGES